MRRTAFKPTGIDALEDRLVPTSFSNPIHLTIVPAGHVNPKNLVLTKRVESQIAPAITKAFNTYQTTLVKDLQAIVKAYNKTGTVPTALVNGAPAALNAATAKLSADLLTISHKVPYGGTNLYPLINARVTGAAPGPAAAGALSGTPLQTELSVLANTAGTLAQQILTEAPQFIPTSLNTLKNNVLVEGKAFVAATAAQVQVDVKDYINLGVTGGEFKLGQGATLPPLS